ncbi:hypothetical protein CLF_103337 [Clonorchis sinensis]|uniref:Uncharacterized protein n=1 Tax=Clonorchis sinensis TaxID=79923 RepID=G7YNE4_CLOSI|nr:hypothetical protein CLF_103337 [Clonorchis sinensis]
MRSAGHTQCRYQLQLQEAVQPCPVDELGDRPNWNSYVIGQLSRDRAVTVLRMIRHTFSRISRMNFQILYEVYVKPVVSDAGSTEPSVGTSSELQRKWLPALIPWTVKRISRCSTSFPWSIVTYEEIQHLALECWSHCFDIRFYVRSKFSKYLTDSDVGNIRPQHMFGRDNPSYILDLKPQFIEQGRAHCLRDEENGISHFVYSTFGLLELFRRIPDFLLIDHRMKFTTINMVGAMHRCLKMELLNGRTGLWEAIRVLRMSATYMIWNRQKAISDTSRRDPHIVGHPELDSHCRRLVPYAISKMASHLCLTHPLTVVSSDEHTTMMRDSRQETQCYTIFRLRLLDERRRRNDKNKIDRQKYRSCISIRESVRDSKSASLRVRQTKNSISLRNHKPHQSSADEKLINMEYEDIALIFDEEEKANVFE